MKAMRTLALASLVGLGLWSAPAPAAETVEHVITFDRVQVRVPSPIAGTGDRPSTDPGSEDYRDEVMRAPGGALAFAPVTAETQRAGIAGHLFVVIINRSAWPVNEVIRVSGPFEGFVRRRLPAGGDR